MFEVPRSTAQDQLAQDQEYVERIRAAVASHDRWRRWWIAFYAVLLICTLALCLWAAQFVNAFMQWPGMQGAAPGFRVGLAIGIAVGFAIISVIHGLFNAMTSTRNEKLMLRYYDALRERK